MKDLKQIASGDFGVGRCKATQQIAKAAWRPSFRRNPQKGYAVGINFLITRSDAHELERVVKPGRRLGAAFVNILRPKPPTTGGGLGELFLPCGLDGPPRGRVKGIRWRTS